MALTEEQMRIRATRITSTDIARIVGLDPYAGKLRVYLDKVGEGEAEPPSSYGEAGSALEEPVARVVAERDGLHLINPGTILSRKHPIVAATPDRLSVHPLPEVDDQGGRRIPEEDEVIEIKTVWTPNARAHYGEEDTDHIPLKHICQTTWEMLATALERARLYAFFPEPGVAFADAIRRYRIPFDLDFASELLEQAERFWRDHVEKREPPPLDETPDSEAYLKRKFPRSRTGAMRPPTQQVNTLAEVLSRLKEQEERREREIAQIENQIKAAIGDADGIETSIGPVTWRSSKARDRVDTEALAREPGVAALVLKHTKAGKAGEGPRVFRGPWSNGRKRS